jgi:molybdopterin molybdotransferase
MAQLSDDCFAFGGALMSVDEAVALIRARVTAVAGIEQLSLQEADGRVLADALHAPVPLPLFANSAVDGYALSSADLPKDEPRAFAARSAFRRAHARSRWRPAQSHAFSPARPCRPAPILFSCRKMWRYRRTVACFCRKA